MTPQLSGQREGHVETAASAVQSLREKFGTGSPIARLLLG